MPIGELFATSRLVGRTYKAMLSCTIVIRLRFRGRRQHRRYETSHRGRGPVFPRRSSSTGSRWRSDSPTRQVSLLFTFILPYSTSPFYCFHYFVIDSDCDILSSNTFAPSHPIPSIHARNQFSRLDFLSLYHPIACPSPRAKRSSNLLPPDLEAKARGLRVL